MLASAGLEGGLPLALSRAMSVAALLSAFGTLVFAVFVAPQACARMPAALAGRIRQQLLLAAQLGLGAGVLATLAWLLLQAADMAGAMSLGPALAALPAVVSGTVFGHLMVVQLVALVAVGLALGRHAGVVRLRVALGLAAVATALQAGHSHAASMYSGPSLLLASVVFHLWGAGIWLGGLVPLLLVVRAAPPKAAATAARWFSPVGKLAIAALVVSAGIQGWVLVAGILGLVGTAYGLTVLVKLALFGVLLAFAGANRYRFAPALLRAHPEAARRLLVRSIALQTGFGVAIVGAAAVLSNLPPAMHLQPWWPFPVQLSLDAVREDADLRLEAIKGAVGLGAAIALLAVAALARRVRWLVAALALVVAWLAVPHLALLLADADPTSFYRSPTGFSATTIAAGAALFPVHCAVCHGVDGHGDGPAAKGLPVPPADLTAAHLLMHTDGELFWWLLHGIAAPDGRAAMPGFADVLSDDQRWDLIDYLRARNAGGVMAATGAWQGAVPAPDFQADCSGRTITLPDLRGHFVRLVIGTAPRAAEGADVVTVVTALGGPAGACVVDDALVPLAYAVVAGIPTASLAGTQFLIDGEGWLRALQRPGAPGSWNDSGALAARMDDMRAHPIVAGDRMDMPM